MGLRSRLVTESLERRLFLAIESATPAMYVDGDTDLMSQSAATAGVIDAGSVAVYSDRDATGKGKDVWLRRYLANGSAVAASERVNTTLSGAQMNVDVAMSSADDYAVVWQSENQDGSGWGIYARAHTSAGWGSETLINVTTAGAQVSPKITTSEAGSFVVTWVGRDDNAGNGEVYLRKLDSTGAPLTSEVKVSTGGNFAHTAPDVAISGSRVTVVWVSSDIANAGQTDVAYRAYDAFLVPSGAGSLVHTPTTGDQAEPAIAPLLTPGEFAVVWSDTRGGGTEAAIVGERFTDSTFAGGGYMVPLQISQDSDGNRNRPQLSSSGGTVAIGWTQQLAGATYSSTVTRAFDGYFNPVSNERAVSDGVNARTLHGLAVTGKGRISELATLGELPGYGVALMSGFWNVLLINGTSAADEVVIYDLDAFTIRVTINGASQNHLRAAYDHLQVELGAGDDKLIADDTTFWASVNGGDGRDSLLGTAAGDSISGGSGNDTIDASGGSDYAIGGDDLDTLYGRDGDDSLTGGAGKDTIYGGLGVDRLSGSGSPDVLHGEDGDDRIYGDAGDDRVDGGGGRDRAYGGDGNDLIVGGSSNDRCYGQAGNDTLNGGKGNDYLDGGLDTDLVVAKEPGDVLISIE